MPSLRTRLSVRIFFLLSIVVLPSLGSAKETSFLSNGVTAHRGSSLEFPENTLTAFREAIKLSAAWVETDIHRTKDGEIVICHDANTIQVADRNLVISESTLEELKSLDMAHQFRKERNLSEKECPVERIPTLSEVLELILSQKRTRLSLQPKADCVTEAMAIIRKHQAQPWVGFNEGLLSRVQRVKELDPTIPVFWDRPDLVDLKRDLSLAKHLKFEALVFHHKAITPELIREVKSAGFEVGSWTVNDPSMMRKFSDWRIDRIYTDDPRIAKSIFKDTK